MKPESASKSQVLLARIAVTVIAVFGAFGLLKYGISNEVHHRFWQDVFDRPGGPMSFRFVLQPIMAAIAAFVDGAKDARLGRQPYLTRLFSGSSDRTELLNGALLSTGRILLLGLAMDGIYQISVLKTFYPGEMVIVALALALAPYLLLRGPFSRLVRWWSIRSGG